MARLGNHREAQANAKIWQRKMKVNAVRDDQKEGRKEFISKFDNLYGHIGNQEMSERANFKSSKMKAKKSKGSFMSKNFKNDSFGEKKFGNEEVKSTSKSGGFGRVIKGIFGSKKKAKA